MQRRIICSALPLFLNMSLLASPNVVIVITDDQGYGDLSCLGNPVLETPAMDALYEESIRLTDYHVSPTCAPTRGALMSGHYTNRAGPWHTIMGRSFLRPESTTLGEVFSTSGYQTGMFGKWHLGDNYPYRAIDRGFTEVVSHAGGGPGQTPDYWNNAYFDDTYMHNGSPKRYEGYCTDVFFNEAMDFIEDSIDQNEPFLAYISTNAPHSPFHCPEHYWMPYTDKVETREEAIFFGMIANIDENLARLRQFLARKGVEDDTILIFTTDNGTAHGHNVYNAEMRGRKASPYDGGHRVPFFLHWPAAELDEPRDVSQLTAHIDILPTLIELCGLESPSDYSFDGRSLAPLLFENPVPWPDRTIVTDSQRVKDPVKWRMSATMTERWRLIDGIELYDIVTDPGQTNDVAEKFPEVVQALRDDYETWWDSVSTLFEKETRIVVGNDAENPVRLTCHDWITDDPVTPWHQAYIRGARPGTGFWALKVDRPGRYAVSLRRWPVEVDTAITEGLPPGDPVPGLTAFRETSGKAIPVKSAILRMGSQSLEKPVKLTDKSVTFNVELPAGDINLEGLFRYGPEEEDIVGAYYAVLERLDDTAARFPDFSWETVPVYIHYGDQDGYPDEAVEFMAAKSNFISMEKSQGYNTHGSAFKGQMEDARRLHAADENIKVVFYWNTFLDYPWSEAHGQYQKNPEWWLRTLDGSLDKKRGNLKRYDLSNPEVREWWTEVVRKAVAEGPCDGVFMDAFPQIGTPANKRLWGKEKYDAIQGGLLKLLKLTREKIGPNKLILYNGIRNTDTFRFGMPFLDLADGAVIEHFGHFSSSSPENMARDLADMMEAGKRGKIIVFKGWPGFSWLDDVAKEKRRGELLEMARENITFPLACFLVAAQPYSYFCYSWGYREDMGSLDWYPEFDKPLGKPLDSATIDGYHYSREFEHCSVEVDLLTRKASINWR
jgi:arylsulfatase B